MTDRELLEFAAKAAGIEWFGIFGDSECECRFLDIGEDTVVEWKPLTDDGDALRLAVKLGLIVEAGQCWISKHGPMYGEDVLPCPYAATRRAIVLAAAAIGKEMP